MTAEVLRVMHIAECVFTQVTNSVSSCVHVIRDEFVKCFAIISRLQLMIGLERCHSPVRADFV